MGPDGQQAANYQALSCHLETVGGPLTSIFRRWRLAKGLLTGKARGPWDVKPLAAAGPVGGENPSPYHSGTEIRTPSLP